MIDSPSKYRARASVLMLATCRGATRGVNSMTTRPSGNSTYRVLSGSSGRQSAGLAAAKTSGILGPWAAGADAEKKASALSPKNLPLSGMYRVLHKRASSLAEGGMRRISARCLVVLAWFCAGAHLALAGGQGYPGGGGQMPGGRPGMGSGMNQPGGEMPSTPAADKPDAAAKKAF